MRHFKLAMKLLADVVYQLGLQGPDLLLREVVRGGALCAESPQVGHGDVDHVLDELAVLPGAQGQLALQPIASRLLV